MAQKMTQAHFNKTLNDIRSQLYRAGLAQAHVEEMCSLILMELAVDYAQGSRTTASKYLIDLGYKLGARIRDPGRTDVTKGTYKPSLMDRVRHALTKAPLPTLSGVVRADVDPASAEELKSIMDKAHPIKLVESKPRIVLPPSSGKRRQ